MRNRFQNFMQGRYGSDQLTNFLSMVALVVIILNLFFRRRILWIIAVVLIVLIYYRMFSRNIAQRSLENDRFMGLISRFRRGGGGRRYSGQNGGSSRSYGSGRFRRGGGGGSSGSYSARERAERFRAQQQDKKYYKYFNCPNCNQKVRVPKGKGKIEITCPKCRTSFIRKT